MSTTPHLVTRERIVSWLNDPNPRKVEAVIGRALVVLLNRQTREEAATNTTNLHNNVGFTGADAKSGSLTAKYWLKHNRLEQWQIDRWTRISPRTRLPRLAKYWRQLDDEARRKQGASV